MSKRKVLVAGGAGFLGSYLCDIYISRGFEVVCIDNLSTGSLENISHLQKLSGFQFYNHDVVYGLPDKLATDKYDVIINMASPASPPQYQRLAIETLQVGSVGTQNLLELAHKCGARFFHASTSEVYGDPEVHPQPESYKGSVNCYGPRSMYDESKRYAEALIYAYRQKHEVSTCIGRFFNTYGPRMDPNDGRVISNFIVQALENKPLTIYGDGSQTRSFCYVDDLVAGICKLIDSGEEGPINLGNPVEFTIKELSEKITRLTSSTSTIEYHPLPGDDPLQRKPVIDKAVKLLGWKPTVELEEGLLQTIRYFSDKLSINTKTKNTSNLLVGRGE